ncbi:hypothetical protein MN0502_05400 [Arthrobacter sp. MN05-02]|nr:hypothetical protein MN0502_05400 [Arthrobacter sp. MN05-02]
MEMTEVVGVAGDRSAEDRSAEDRIAEDRIAEDGTGDDAQARTRLTLIHGGWTAADPQDLYEFYTGFWLGALARYRRFMGGS